MTKSILAHHKTINISKTLIVEEYSYVYIDGFDAKRPPEKHKTKRHFGWKVIGVERECVKGSKGCLWIYREVLQKGK